MASTVHAWGKYVTILRTHHVVAHVTYCAEYYLRKTDFYEKEGVRIA
jgi:hypothetical protein